MPIKHFVALITLALVACSPSNRPRITDVNIDTHLGPVTFSVELAHTRSQKAQGLQGRTELSDSQGMLFLYDRSQIVTFWMHDTALTLDMIFIDDRDTITEIVSDVEPYSQHPIKSNKAVIAVLEIKGGQAEKVSIRAGDRVIYRSVKDEVNPK